MNTTTNSDDVHLEGDGISRNQFTFGDNESAYQENSFIHHQLLKIKLSKVFYLVLGIILMISVTCMVIASLNGNETDQINESKKRSPVNLLRSIVITSGKDIWTFDIDSKKCVFLKSSKNEITAMDTYLEKTVFWSEANASTINCLWNEHANISHTKRLKPQAIAVDYVTDKMYLVDKASGSLGIIDMKRKHFGLVYSDLEEPHDLVLDPAEGLMFVVQYYKSIIRANMDGTSVKTIAEGARISAIAVDRKARRVYWSDDQSSIESCDYDGSNRQTVVTIPMSILSLAVLENRLYWTRSVSRADMCPCNNVLWSCSLYRRACGNVTSHRLPFEAPRLLRSSHEQQRQHPLGNPCARDNGGCEQLCLMTSRGSHDCGCAVGWTLGPDGRSCGPVARLILYAQGEFVRSRIVGPERNESFVGASLPTRFRAESLTKKTSIHFDYDVTSGEFYFSDDRSLYRINLLRDDEQTRLLNVSESYVIKDVVYDWTKDSVYYVRQSQEPASNHSILAFNVKGATGPKAQRTILTAKFKKETYIDCPHDLAIHPGHEYLFFSDYNGVNDNLRRASSNGKGLILWKPFYSNVQLNFLTVDPERSRLYWSTSASPTLIKSANLEGSEEESVQVLSVTNLLYAGVRDWLYVGNFTEIWAVRRDSGAEPIRLVRTRYRKADDGRLKYEHVHGLRVVSVAARNAA